MFVCIKGATFDSHDVAGEAAEERRGQSSWPSALWTYRRARLSYWWRIPATPWP